MSQTLTDIVAAVSHAVSATASQSSVPLMVVASYAGTALVLYGLTRGREFLIAGYSSALFLVPFIHLS